MVMAEPSVSRPTPILVPLNLRPIIDRMVPRRSSDAALAAVTPLMSRCFSIISPFAANFACVGGEVAVQDDARFVGGHPPISVTGNGEVLDAALRSCLGEAAEALSQLERVGDVAARGRPNDMGVADSADLLPDHLRERPIDWVAATDARTGETKLVPADLCLRRPASRREMDPVGPLSSGVAAARDRDGASLRAILELCERDALALWWYLGRPARRLDPGDSTSEAASDLVTRLRGRYAGRITTIVDLTTDIAVPTIAALSTDLEGRGLACGAAARLDPLAAMEAAVLEMCQMELSAPLAALKLAQDGEEALNDADRRHLRRAARRTWGLRALRFMPPATRPGAWAPCDLADLVERLWEYGASVTLLDLTRADVGVPVVRALAPGLQPFVATPRTNLAHRTLAAFGPDDSAAGMPLF